MTPRPRFPDNIEVRTGTKMPPTPPSSLPVVSPPTKIGEALDAFLKADWYLCYNCGYSERDHGAGVRPTCNGYESERDVARARVLALVDGLAEDARRLDWMEANGRIAENNPMARVFAIAAHKEWTLREAIDTSRTVDAARSSEGTTDGR